MKTITSGAGQLPTNSAATLAEMVARHHCLTRKPASCNCCIGSASGCPGSNSEFQPDKHISAEVTPWCLQAIPCSRWKPTYRCCGYNDMVVAVTELNIRTFWGFLRFIPHAVRSKRAAERAPGIVSVRVKSIGFYCQRTLTVWENRDAMLAFVRSEPHLSAMQLAPQIAKESYTVNYEVSQPPDWPEALAYLREHGRPY